MWSVKSNKKIAQSSKTKIMMEKIKRFGGHIREEAIIKLVTKENLLGPKTGLNLQIKKSLFYSRYRTMHNQVNS